MAGYDDAVGQGHILPKNVPNVAAVRFSRSRPFPFVRCSG